MTDLEKAKVIVRDVLRSQGARHPRATTDSLAEYLMTGGVPATYGERFAQMKLQIEGLIK
jgi:hypothetical protein